MIDVDIVQSEETIKTYYTKEIEDEIMGYIDHN